MIIEPVASRGDSATYLEEPFVGNLLILPILVQASEFRRVLRGRAVHEPFGCLASGMLFMHDHNIRYKDIKLENILVHQKDASTAPTCLHTDFGLSSNHGKDGVSWTTGKSKGSTPKYRSPEVAGWERRGLKSDIFFLECVYIEIGQAISEPRTSNELLEGHYHEELVSLPLQGFLPQSPSKPLDMVGAMVRRNPSAIPSAKQVVRLLLKRTFPSEHFCRACLNLESSKADRVESPNSDTALFDLCSVYSTTLLHR